MKTRNVNVIGSRAVLSTAFVIAVSLLVGCAGELATGERPAKGIAQADIVAAQKAWGEALVQIARTQETEGAQRAREMAAAVIDSAYGYQMGPVLFKPTLTVGAQTFRTTREGALAYFAGGDARFPNDTGFAFKGWRQVEMSNAGFQFQGDTAQVISKVRLTDRFGLVTEVDKTWGYRRDAEGRLRIVIHHSSLARSE